MSRRIDIELTSARPDGTWTWRAAGAREPRGVVPETLIFEGAKAGDVVKAEADFEIEGITILSVTPLKEKKRTAVQRIEILGSGRADEPGVTTQLVGKGGRGGGDRDARRGGDRPDRPRRDAGGPGGSGRPARAGGPRPVTPSGRDGANQDRRTEQRSEHRPSGADSSAEAVPRDGRRTVGEGPGRGQAGRPTNPSTRPKARKLSAGNVHRTALLEELAPEERVVAEQVLRGGVPAVRSALHLEREKAVAEGRPAPDTDALVTLAERLLPRLRTAEWHDRAEAAIKATDDISLRDLRAVVTGADAARDDETRTLASTLREVLDGRITKLRTSWVDEVRAHLEAGRVIRAVRLSGRPPEPSTRLPADLLDELATHAGAGLAPDTTPDQWLAMLEAVAASPVRRSVKPAGLPKAPGPDLDRIARQQSGRVPGLAALLGIAIPPPPGPRRRLGEDGGPSRATPPPPPVVPPTVAKMDPLATETVVTAPAPPEPVAPKPVVAEPVVAEPVVAAPIVEPAQVPGLETDLPVPSEG